MNEERREELGKLVRQIWIDWAGGQKRPKEQWTEPWERVPEHIKDVDRRIGEAVAKDTVNECLDVLSCILHNQLKGIMGPTWEEREAYLKQALLIVKAAQQISKDVL